MDSFKVISLFSGIGGIDLGFIQAGFDIVWANDIDPDVCKTYEANFGECSICEGDICSIATKDIPIVTEGMKNVEVTLASSPALLGEIAFAEAMPKVRRGSKR